MFKFATVWDLRALLWILDPISRVYALFALITAIWMVATALRVMVLTRHSRRIVGQEFVQPRLVSKERHLRAFFSLNVILFSGCFFNELLLGIRALTFMLTNPNLDSVPPFDGLIFLSALGFALLALIHCTRWYVLCKTTQS